VGPDCGAAILEHTVPFAPGCVAAPSQEPTDPQPAVALHAAGSSPHGGTVAATGDLKLSSLVTPRFDIKKAAGEPSRIRRQGYHFIALAREVGLEPVKAVRGYGPFSNLAHDLFFVLVDSKPNPIVFSAVLPVLLALSFLEF